MLFWLLPSEFFPCRKIQIFSVNNPRITHKKLFQHFSSLIFSLFSLNFFLFCFFQFQLFYFLFFPSLLQLCPFSIQILNDQSNLYSNLMDSTQGFILLLVLAISMQVNSSSCPPGYYLQSGKCKSSPNQSNITPLKGTFGSFFSSKYFTTTFTKCKETQIWDGNSCICQNGFFRISQDCIKCDPNSDYVGYDCICKKGFFGYGQQRCYQCHNSCQKCFGPRETQCISCIDHQQVLTKFNGIDGICTSSFVTPQPLRCYLSLENYAILGNKIIQGIHLSELPKQLSDRSCFYCDKVLLIQGRSSVGLLTPSKIQYREGSHYKIQAQFDFKGFLPQIEVIVEISPLYKSYFNPLDQNQRITRLIQLQNYAIASSGSTLKTSSVDKKTSDSSSNYISPGILFP